MGEDGRARGFCHIEFADPAHAEAAMKFNGQEIDGRAIRLDLSAPRQGGGGRGGRGGFGDRGGRGCFGDRGRGGLGGRGGFGDRGGRGGFGARGRGGFGGRGGGRGFGDRGRGGFNPAQRGSIQPYAGTKTTF